MADNIPNTIVDDAVAEIESALPDAELSHEGFDDYEDLNVEQPTKDLSISMKLKWEKRQDLMKKAIEANKALLNDGYPDPIEAEADDHLLQDMDAQIESLQKARSLVKKRPPVTKGFFQFRDIVKVLVLGVGLTLFTVPAYAQSLPLPQFCYYIGGSLKCFSYKAMQETKIVKKKNSKGQRITCYGPPIPDPPQCVVGPSRNVCQVTGGGWAVCVK